MKGRITSEEKKKIILGCGEVAAKQSFAAKICVGELRSNIVVQKCGAELRQSVEPKHFAKALRQSITSGVEPKSYAEVLSGSVAATCCGRALYRSVALTRYIEGLRKWRQLENLLMLKNPEDAASILT